MSSASLLTEQSDRKHIYVWERAKKVITQARNQKMLLPAPQMVLAEMLTRGSFTAHMRKMRVLYRSRRLRLALLASLSQQPLPQRARCAALPLLSLPTHARVVRAPLMRCAQTIRRAIA